MNIFYNIMLMYALAFVIGLFVSCIIWLLYSTMTAKNDSRNSLRETYSEIRRLRRKKS